MRRETTIVTHRRRPRSIAGSANLTPRLAATGSVDRTQALAVLALASLCLTIVFYAWGLPEKNFAPSQAPIDKHVRAQGWATDALGKLAMSFMENRGQLDPQVDFYLQQETSTVYFTPEGLTLAMRNPALKPTAAPSHGKPSHDNSNVQEPSQDQLPTEWVLKQDFVDAARVRSTARGSTGSLVSYFKGGPWRTGIRTYSTLRYTDLWPGIDLIYSVSRGGLKYQFLVRPGADPNQIRLRYRGANDVRVTQGGDLEASTPFGLIRDDKPRSYQKIGARRVAVRSAYALNPSPSARPPTFGSDLAGGWEYGFSLGDYDPSRPLIIDPTVLVYGGYVGGNHDDQGLGIDVDKNGNAYITGQTRSSSGTFPSVVGPDRSGGQGWDAFVVKISADGKKILYAGYIGGDGDDFGFDVEVDEVGSAYVTGATYSDHFTFPVLGGPDLKHNGSYDAYVTKVDPSGARLVYSGYIGGNSVDVGENIALDSERNAYVTGFTESTEFSFPVRGGPDLTFNGLMDAFVAKVASTGRQLIYCGYVGGLGEDAGVRGAVTAGGIAVDAGGNAYISGITNSDESTFPDGDGFGSLVGPDQTWNGARDAFVAKIAASGRALVYAGYIGGAGDDFAKSMSVDGVGAAYLAGDTSSPESTFPVLVGPDLSYNGGVIDAFVAKVLPSGEALEYSGYIGGADLDQALGAEVDHAGNLYVVGHTHSSEETFPVIDGPDITFNALGGAGDAFIAKVKARPSSNVVLKNLAYSGYIGGDSEDGAFWVAVDRVGNAYVVGSATSTESTFPDGDGFGDLPGPDQSFNNHVGGLRDAFVAKVGSTQ